VILAESVPTWGWLAVEALFVSLLMIAGTLWRRVRTASAAPEVVARYRTGTLLCAFWTVLVALRLLTHAY
jgi:hypothetical protein